MRVIAGATVVLALGLGGAARTEELVSELMIRPIDGGAGDLFGLSVSADGDTVVMGAPWHGVGGVDSGSAYVLVRTDSEWGQGAELTPDEAGSGDRFGCSVSVSGDTVVVGVPYHDDNGTDAGSVYVFVRSDSIWSQTARLTPGDAAAGDLFGSSVAVSGDTMVVGAPTNDTNGVDAGSAYVFVREGSTWTEAATLTPDDGAAGDRFGCSVSVSGDTVIVGAYLDGDNGGSSGSAYVFVRSGWTWSQAAKLTPHDGAAFDLFGVSVSVESDTAVVGAPFDDDSGMESGSAYVFARSGSAWSQSAKLTAADGADADWFGVSVSVSGNIVLVGASLDDDNGLDSGSAHVFVRSGSTWQEEAKYTALGGTPYDGFGYSVSVSGDSAVAGAPYAGADSGAVHFFDLGLANPVVTLVASDPEAHESGDPGSFTVTRTGVPTDSDLTVWYTVSGSAENGVDYNASFPLDGMVTILAGNTDAVVYIDPVPDGDIEGSETVTLTLVASPAYNLGVEASDGVVIAENEGPANAVVTLAASDPDAHESGDPGSFTVTRTGGATDSDLMAWYTVAGSAENGVDYNASFPLDGMVTILAGSTDAVVHIDPVSDDDIEGSETVTLTLVASPAYILGVEVSDTVVIAENEPAGDAVEEPHPFASQRLFLSQEGDEGGCAPGAASPIGFTYCLLIALLVLTWKRSPRDGRSVMRSRDTSAKCGGRGAPCDSSIALAERAHQ